MIFAAGLGTRLKPLTDTMPKALVRVGEQPLLWHVIMRLKAVGVERIVVNVHHFAWQIVDYLKANGHFGLDLRISDESQQLLDTGGGIKKARTLFDTSEPVLIHNVDILSNADLSSLFTGGNRQQQPRPDALLLVSRRTTTRYLQFDGDMRLVGWKNETTGQVRGIEGRPLAFSGIHLLHPSLFPLMDQLPDRFPIMDFYLSHCSDCLLMGVEDPALQLMDVGKADTLDAAELFLERLSKK